MRRGRRRRRRWCPTTGTLKDPDSNNLPRSKKTAPSAPRVMPTTGSRSDPPVRTDLPQVGACDQVIHQTEKFRRQLILRRVNIDDDGMPASRAQVAA